MRKGRTGEFRNVDAGVMCMMDEGARVSCADSALGYVCIWAR